MKPGTGGASLSKRREETGWMLEEEAALARCCQCRGSRNGLCCWGVASQISSPAKVNARSLQRAAGSPSLGARAAVGEASVQAALGCYSEVSWSICSLLPAGCARRRRSPWRQCLACCCSAALSSGCLAPCIAGCCTRKLCRWGWVWECSANMCKNPSQNKSWHRALQGHEWAAWLSFIGHEVKVTQ